MQITAVNILSAPRKWSSGDKLLAYFNVRYAGLELRDAMLIRGVRTGQLIAQPPRGENRLGERAIRIVDDKTRDAMAAAAYQAYRALGGAA